MLAVSEGKRRKISYLTTKSCGMAKVVNLRMARKRAARTEQARNAAENRITHGVSKAGRDRAESDRESNLRFLDQHKIDTGGRR